ncbi:hypothetical protein K1719_040531 [Acacia pycnantha]|nr:hypothetical protein K1719_040531 [Acacia pycnantha]
MRNNFRVTSSIAVPSGSIDLTGNESRSVGASCGNIPSFGRRKASLLTVPENPTEQKVQIPDYNICFGSYFCSLSLSAICARAGFQGTLNA